MIKNENFYVVHGWMLNELQLKGNELLVYAIIYGFSQTENQHFTGSLNYLSEFTGATKQTVINVINSLIEKGLIEKTERVYNGVKFCEYQSKIFGGSQNFLMGSQKIRQGVVKNFDGGSQNFLPNNIEYNIGDNIENKKTGDTPEPPVFDLPAKAQKKKTKQQELQEIVESYTQNPQLQQALFDFIEYRKKSKANFSTKALKLNLAKLDKLTSGGDDNEKIEIINQTIECGWSGLFPLRQNKSCGNGKRPAHDIIREQEMEDIHKYLDLVD